VIGDVRTLSFRRSSAGCRDFYSSGDDRQVVSSSLAENNRKVVNVAQTIGVAIRITTASILLLKLSSFRTDELNVGDRALSFMFSFRVADHVIGVLRGSSRTSHSTCRTLTSSWPWEVFERRST